VFNGHKYIARATTPLLNALKSKTSDIRLKKTSDSNRETRERQASLMPTSQEATASRTAMTTTLQLPFPQFQNAAGRCRRDEANRINVQKLDCKMDKVVERFEESRISLPTGQNKTGKANHAGRLAQLCDKSVSTKSAHTQG
jgi:hypothetical protein